jgi:anaerobic selenocysteine-containing dehydrogenase
VVFLNPDDIRLGGFHEGQTVDLTSHFEGEERVAHRFTIVTYSIPRHCAATYFPETNVLVPVRNFADKSNTPASKSVVISIRASARGPEPSDGQDSQDLQDSKNRPVEIV